jgi:hypothetical protein
MEQRQVRTAEIRLIKYDLPAVNIRYTGRSASLRAADGDLVWQIMREYRIGDSTVSTYASMGSFNCSWTDRASYFTAATEDPNSPLIDAVPSYPTGLKNSGLVTIVSINDTTWTALPATALVGRNAIAIQNRSGQEIKLNYNNATAGYVGIFLGTGFDRFYDITDGIIVYAKSASSACTLVVEELS